VRTFRRSFLALVLLPAFSVCLAGKTVVGSFVPDAGVPGAPSLDGQVFKIESPGFAARVALLDDASRQEFLKARLGRTTDPFLAAPREGRPGFLTFLLELENRGGGTLYFQPLMCPITTPQGDIRSPLDRDTLQTTYEMLDKSCPRLRGRGEGALLESSRPALGAGRIRPPRVPDGRALHEDAAPGDPGDHVDGGGRGVPAPLSIREGEEAEQGERAMTGTAKLLDGKTIARRIREEVASTCARLEASRGIVPGLSVVLVGDDPASAIYVRNKEAAAREVGMRSQVLRMPATSTEGEILRAVDGLNRDHVHGILVQLPLPEGIDEHRVQQAIDPDKDVDGLHPANAGRLLVGLPGFVPCTPAGILELLKRSDVPLAGRRAVVIGRSNIVGKPMAVLLLREDCTVTVCHSRTRDLAAIASEADVLIVAIGRPAFVTRSFIKPGAAVVDVGIHSITDEETCRRIFGNDPARLKAVRERGSTLVGDVHPLEAAERAGWLSPVPGGVGPLTIALLLRNTYESAAAAGSVS
jgi:methylenetetrahydrofolate dehydrogenase (NADP+)/methenyltetrahydrofolate cyclohydrolase